MGYHAATTRIIELLLSYYRVYPKDQFEASFFLIFI